MPHFIQDVWILKKINGVIQATPAQLELAETDNKQRPRFTLNSVLQSPGAWILAQDGHAVLHAYIQNENKNTLYRFSVEHLKDASTNENNSPKFIYRVMRRSLSSNEGNLGRIESEKDLASILKLLGDKAIFDAHSLYENLQKYQFFARELMIPSQRTEKKPRERKEERIKKYISWLDEALEKNLVIPSKSSATGKEGKLITFAYPWLYRNIDAFLFNIAQDDEDLLKAIQFILLNKNEDEKNKPVFQSISIMNQMLFPTSFKNIALPSKLTDVEIYEFCLKTLIFLVRKLLPDEEILFAEKSAPVENNQRQIIYYCTLEDKQREFRSLHSGSYAR